MFVGTECTFGSLCEASQCRRSVVQECVCAYSKTFLLKNIMFGSFPGYAFGSHFSERFTHIHDGTQPHINTHGPWAGHIQQFCSSSRRCHSVTSSTGLAVSHGVLLLEPEISFNRAHPVTLLCHSGAQTGSEQG